MADYYTKGCVALTLSPECLEWAHAVLKAACLIGGLPKEKRALHPLDKNFTAEHFQWANFIIEGGTDFGTSGVYFTIDLVGYTLYAYNDENFDIIQAARWLQSIIKKFNLDRPFGFLYTRDCSKARPDGYGGGAVIVKKDSITVFDADQWLGQKLAE